MLDPVHHVRTKYLSLLKSIFTSAKSATLPSATHIIVPHLHLLTLHIHSAMTHISEDVRQDSTKLLDLLLEAAPAEMVVTQWLSTVSSFAAILGWPVPHHHTGIKMHVKVPLIPMSNVAVHLQHLNVLQRLLLAGLKDTSTGPNVKHVEVYAARLSKLMYSSLVRHPLASLYLLPQSPAVYNRLNLFQITLDNSNHSTGSKFYNDLPARKQIFALQLRGFITYLNDLWAETDLAYNLAEVESESNTKKMNQKLNNLQRQRRELMKLIFELVIFVHQVYGLSDEEDDVEVAVPLQTKQLAHSLMAKVKSTR